MCRTLGWHGYSIVDVDEQCRWSLDKASPADYGPVIWSRDTAVGADRSAQAGNSSKSSMRVHSSAGTGPDLVMSSWFTEPLHAGWDGRRKIPIGPQVSQEVRMSDTPSYCRPTDPHFRYLLQTSSQH